MLVFLMEKLTTDAVPTGHPSLEEARGQKGLVQSSVNMDGKHSLGGLLWLQLWCSTSCPDLV